MKILLINPPSNSPQPIMPLGLAYLAAALRKNNFLVEVIDAWVERLDFDRLAKRIMEMGYYDLIGITVSSPCYAEAVKTIRVVKQASPNSKIIIGGTHPSSLPEECMNENPEIDFVAVGEGDKLIVDVASALASQQPDFSGIKGLLYRDKGQIINNGRAEPIKNLDELPFPARDLFPIFKYSTHPPYRLHKAYATMITSRGCPYHCTVCTKSVSGQNYRFQSAKRVADEIEFLIDKYKIKQIHFYDDDFTLNMKRAEELCDTLINKKIKILWSCVTRVDLVNEHLLEKMRQAGCWLIAYGVESGDQHILDNIKKGYNLEQVKNAFRLTKKVGIRSLGYFMAGLPGETYATLDKTVDLSLALEPDFVAWSITALYPGSELYQQALDGKLGNNYALIKAPIALHFSNVSGLSPFAHGHTYIYEGNIPRDYIFKVVDRAYKRFYFRLSYLISFLFKLQTLTEVLSYLRTLSSFFAWNIKRS